MSNIKSGIVVTASEIEAAFEFFDVDKKGLVNIQDLRRRLSVFYKNMPSKDYRFLMNNKAEFSLEDLKDLLIDNEVSGFDPAVEAFRCYDPHGTGFIDTDTLRTLFQALGFGAISDEDLAVLIETGDLDKDGRISLEDFRSMVDLGGNEVGSKPPRQTKGGAGSKGAAKTATR